MKTKLTIGLTVAMMTASRIGSAQGLTTDVGIPLAGPWNPGAAVITMNVVGQEGVVLPVIGDPFLPFTSLSPGDVILLADPNGGDAPSNWAAVIRCFNPSDPTGQQGLPATETQGFFPADEGPGGFASYQLFPNYNFVPSDPTSTSDSVIGFGKHFGPIEGIPAGQLGIIFFQAIVPEPGTLALLGLGGIALALNARRRRT